MAAVKRKEPPPTRVQNGNKVKKSKKESAPKSRSTNRETEPDSDPIVESDTTENSGDDDGISWPDDDDDDDDDDEWKGSRQVQEPAKASSKPSDKDTTNITNTTTLTSSSSRESHAKQKALAHERRASKPNADSIARSKKLWERLRRKSHVPRAERKELIAELFGIVSGHVKDFVLKHDSVRVIQTALKYANVDQRRMIAKELKGEYKGLAESRYAKFLVGKLVGHGDKEVRDMVVPEFFGSVRRLIRHPEAGWILDDIYRGAATEEQKRRMLREWYGAEFALFREKNTKGEEEVELKEILRKNPEKKTPIMRSLWELINQLVQKKTTGFTMLHDAMLQYFLNLTPRSSEANEFLELLKGDEEGDLLKNMAFTPSGARLVALALAHGQAKDRKLILRTYKSMIQTLAANIYGHQILLAAYDTVDDTVLTSKLIFSELVPSPPTETALEMLTNVTHRIPILYLFSGPQKSLLPPSDLALISELHSLRSEMGTSKKDPDLRRKELLAHISPPLLNLLATHMQQLTESSFGCQAVTEILLSSISNDKTAVLDELSNLIISSPPEFLDPPHVCRMLKSLVQGGRYDPKTRTVKETDPPLDFHNRLFELLEREGKLLEWASSRSLSWSIVAMLESGSFAHGDKLRGMLSAEREVLLKTAEDEEEGGKGARKIVELLGQIK